jgi:hypothetical protein
LQALFFNFFEIQETTTLKWIPESHPAKSSTVISHSVFLNAFQKMQKALSHFKIKDLFFDHLTVKKISFKTFH